MKQGSKNEMSWFSKSTQKKKKKRYIEMNFFGSNKT